MSSSPPSLFSSRDFRLLLAGQTTSQLGTQIAGVAMPLLACAIVAVRAPLVRIADAPLHPAGS